MKSNREHFFSRCRNPLAVSEVITSLAAGTPLNALRLPLDVLPSVVLLATIGLRAFDQQIVDDYELLLERMLETFRDPVLTHAHYDHPDLMLVGCIVNGGARGPFFLDSAIGAAYMFEVYEELVNADIEVLFAPLHRKSA